VSTNHSLTNQAQNITRYIILALSFVNIDVPPNRCLCLGLFVLCDGRYLWLLALPLIPTILNARCSVRTRWQTWFEVHTHTHTDTHTQTHTHTDTHTHRHTQTHTHTHTDTHTHTHTHTHQLSVTVYPAADSFLSNAIAHSNNPTTPQPPELFKCPSNNTSTWQNRHHDVNKTQEINFHLTKTNKGVWGGRVKCVARIAVSQAPWLNCEGAPAHFGRYWERTDSGTYLAT
jgi:hypothetical protein